MKKSFFKMAKKEMKRSDYSGPARIGCAVYYKGTLLAKGHNSNKTSPIQDKYNFYRYKSNSNSYLPPKNHAEIATLKKIRYLDIDFSKVEVYTYRELKNGHVANSRPCPSCMKFIKDLRIKKIYYTTDDGYAEERLV